MVTADMYWGSSCIPSGVPQGLTVSYNPTTGRGLEIKGQVTGPGCGNAFTGCPEREADLTFLGSFHLGADRMPDRGCRFTSSPQVLFLDSFLRARALDCAGFDCSSAKCGVRVRQTAYSGVYVIGQRTLAMQNVIVAEASGDFWPLDYDMPDSLDIPSITWQLDRMRPVQIDIEVRFRMKVEGDGNIQFGGYMHPFLFDVPQWAIFANDA